MSLIVGESFHFGEEKTHVTKLNYAYGIRLLFSDELCSINFSGVCR